eukprot:8880416-Pyramimonas_sp.AAC.1
MSEGQFARLVRTSKFCTGSQWDAICHSFTEPCGGSGRCGVAVAPPPLCNWGQGSRVPASPQWERRYPSTLGGRAAGTRPYLVAFVVVELPSLEHNY